MVPVWYDIALDVAPTALDMTVTDPALRALNDVLRNDEPQLAVYVAIGALTEGPDGFVVKHPTALSSLEERAELNGFAARINDVRGELYWAFGRANGAEGDEAVEAQVGGICGALWSALRSEQHGLR